MIPACDDQFHVRQSLRDHVESLDHELQPFVRAPFSKSENTVDGIPAACKVREFRPACQNAMRAQVNVVASVFVIQDFAIARH